MASTKIKKEVKKEPTGSDDEWEEEYVLLELPDFDKTRFCETCSSIDVSKIDSKRPELVLDHQFEYIGTHGDSVGTLLHFQGDQYLGKCTKKVTFHLKRSDAENPSDPDLRLLSRKNIAGAYVPATPEIKKADGTVVSSPGS